LERRPCFDAENRIFQGLGNILYSRYHHSIRPGQEPLEICRVTFEVIIHLICWEADKPKDTRSRLSIFTSAWKSMRRSIWLYLILVQSDCRADPGILDLLLATPMMAIYYFVTLAHESVHNIVIIGDPLWCDRIACLTYSSMIVLDRWRSCKETLELEFLFVVFSVWKVNDFWILTSKLIHCWRTYLEASWHIFSCYMYPGPDPIIIFVIAVVYLSIQSGLLRCLLSHTDEMSFCVLGSQLVIK